MIYWCVKNCILEEDNIPESAFCLAVKIQFLFSVSVIQLSRSENLQTTLESDWIRRMSQNDAVAIRELPTVESCGDTEHVHRGPCLRLLCHAR